MRADSRSIHPSPTTGRRIRRSHTRTALSAASALLLVTACTGSDGTVDGDATATPDEDTTAPVSESTSPTPSSSPSEASTDDEQTAGRVPITPTMQTPDLDERCTVEVDLLGIDEVSYAVPSDWKVDGGCAILDPELDELPQQTEVEAAIFVSVNDASFRQVTAPGGPDETQEVWLGARAGYQASRATAVSTGEALRPEGWPTTSYLVNLGPGTDDGGVLTMSTGVGEDDGYARARAALDVIADTLTITPAADDETSDGFTVLRVQGGGTAYAVTFDGDCFHYRPGNPSDDPTAELCDVDPQDGVIVAGELEDSTLVGYAPPAAIGVEGDTNDTVHALTASVEGGSVFALTTAEMPSELTAVGPGGEELVTAGID